VTHVGIRNPFFLHLDFEALLDHLGVIFDVLGLKLEVEFPCFLFTVFKEVFKGILLLYFFVSHVGQVDEMGKIIAAVVNSSLNQE